MPSHLATSSLLLPQLPHSRLQLVFLPLLESFVPVLPPSLVRGSELMQATQLARHLMPSWSQDAMCITLNRVAMGTGLQSSWERAPQMETSLEPC